jgi:hypothetical protein
MVIELSYFVKSLVTINQEEAEQLAEEPGVRQERSSSTLAGPFCMIPS